MFVFGGEQEWIEPPGTPFGRCQKIIESWQKSKILLVESVRILIFVVLKELDEGNTYRTAPFWTLSQTQCLRLWDAGGMKRHVEDQKHRRCSDWLPHFSGGPGFASKGFTIATGDVLTMYLNIFEVYGDDFELQIMHKWSINESLP